ncbi:MAG: oligosaccharide flippase family protein [Clostridia bacterium]|nr:oligosaccharide flippase family protein [Clostridia bacterium]
MHGEISETEKKKSRIPFLRLPARASAWYAASALVTRGTSFLLTPVFTRVLNGESYGVYPLYASWMSILSAVMTLETGSASLYGGFAKFEGKDRDFTKSALAVLMSVFFALCVPLFVFIKPLSRFSGLPVFLLALMSVHIFFEASASLICTRERYFYGYKQVFIANTVAAVTAPVTALLIIPFLPSFARSIGAVLGALASTAYLLVILKGKLGRANGEMMRYVFLTCLSMLPSLASTVLLSSVDKLMISKYYGAFALAKYSVAHSLGLTLTFVTASVFGALKPWITRKLSKGDVKAVRESVSLLFTVFCTLTLALCCLAPELFAFLAPTEYLDALPAVYVFALCALPMFLSGTSSCVLLARGRPLASSLSALFAAAVNIGLNALIFTRLSYAYASVTFLFSYVILSLLTRHFCGDGKVVEKKLFLILGLTALTVIASYLLRGALLARLLMLAALVLPTLGIFKRMVNKVKEN